MRNTRCLFISDLHLEPSSGRRNRGFEAFLEHRLGECDELYILGDLVEVWIGDDDDDPFADWLRALLRRGADRCALHLMHGNRDFLIGERFLAQTGAKLLADPCLIERNGTRMLLSHGDAYCTADHDYQRMRALLRSPQWQADTLSRSLAERREMARALRAESAAASANKAENIMDVAEDAILGALAGHGADVMIHGHTHRPAMHDHRVHARPVRRYVLGEWDHCGWMLAGGAGGFELRRFPL